MNVQGRSIELFFIDGNPEGMLTAQVPFNWTGHILVANRTQLPDALKRPESSKTGVYILYGDDKDGPMAYIGESEDIGGRIKSHEANKDWWTRVVLITDAGDELNKAHVKYIESRLVEVASDANRIRLENANAPQRSSLSEANTANMEKFIENIQTVLPAIRIDWMQKETRPSLTSKENTNELGVETIFELNTPRVGIYATAKLVDGEFVVQAGSKARNEWVGEGYADSTHGKLYRDIDESGLFELVDGFKILKDNYAFKSTSAAAAVFNGRAATGPISWKVLGTEITYKDWEAGQLGEE